MSVSLTPPLSGGSGTFSIATWNIRSVRGSGLGAAAKGLRQMRVGCCVLTETKLTDDRYSKTSSGYCVILSKAMSPKQGWVALLWEERHQDFEVEAVTIVSPNLLRFQLVTGEERYFVMGAYTPPPLTRRGWMTSAPPGLLAPLTVNRCCWAISTSISEPHKRSVRRSLRFSLTKSTSSRRRASLFSARADDRDLGHGGLGGSGGGEGGITPSQIMLWPGGWTRRHFGVWAFDSRGSMIRTIALSLPIFRGEGRGGSRNIGGAARSSPSNLHHWGNRMGPHDYLGG
jgi:hypothetical protein